MLTFTSTLESCKTSKIHGWVSAVFNWPTKKFSVSVVHVAHIKNLKLVNLEMFLILMIL